MGFGIIFKMDNIVLTKSVKLKIQTFFRKYIIKYQKYNIECDLDIELWTFNSLYAQSFTGLLQVVK